MIFYWLLLHLHGCMKRDSMDFTCVANVLCDCHVYTFTEKKPTTYFGFLFHLVSICHGFLFLQTWMVVEQATKVFKVKRWKIKYKVSINWISSIIVFNLNAVLNHSKRERASKRERLKSMRNSTFRKSWFFIERNRLIKKTDRFQLIF